MDTDGISNFVIGMGEVGGAIQAILECDYYDPKLNTIDRSKAYDVLHICFPYSEKFVEQVEEFQNIYCPELIVIHSTVPVGTSELCVAVHSPVRGKHPNLIGGVRTFVKFFGGQRAKEASAIFEARGIKCHITDKSETTEAMKLWDTTQYGVNIVLEKIIHKYCDENGLDFNVVYTLANKTYNDGYEELGNPEYKKYVLKHVDGVIGGHCVLQNLPLLNNERINDFFK